MLLFLQHPLPSPCIPYLNGAALPCDAILCKDHLGKHTFTQHQLVMNDEAV